MPWNSVNNYWWKPISPNKALCFCSVWGNSQKIPDAAQSFVLSLSEGLMFLNSLCDRFDRRIAWSLTRQLGYDDKSIQGTGCRADTAVLSRYPRCSVTLFSVNVWGDLNVLNPANSLDVFTFFLLYFKALLHDHRIIKVIKQNWNLELAGVFMRLSHAILGNLIS